MPNKCGFWYLECIREADGGDVWVLLEVHIAVEPDDGEIVVEVAAVELWMDADAEDVQLNVGVELAVVVHVPFAQPHPQLLWSGGIVFNFIFTVNLKA